MDVAFINRWGRGGGVIWDIEMAKHLRELGISVTFYIGKSESKGFKHPVSEVENYVPIPTVDLVDYAKAAPPGIGGALRDLDMKIFAKKINREINYSSYDVIHVNSVISLGEHIDSTPSTIKLNGPPHSLWHDVINPYSSSYDRLQLFDEIIATGVTTPCVESNINRDVVTINPGVDTTRFTPEGSAVETSGATVLWVGRFAPVKDLPTLIDAFAMVLDEFPDAELWLVGEGPLEKRVEKRCQKQGIRDQVKFWGFVPNGEVESYYRAADVFALSSKTENHPIALMEAMSCGRPVVAPGIGWIPEMISDGTDGIVIPSRNAQALRDAVINCLDQGEKFGNKARQTAIEEFSWDIKARRMQNLFQNLLIPPN